MDIPYKRRPEIPGMTDRDDRLIGMIVALTSQVAAMRDRIDALETVLARSGTLPANAIETFEPDAADLDRRDELRQRLIARVMQPLRDAVARDAADTGGKP